MQQGDGERSEPHHTRIRRRTPKSKRPHCGSRGCLALEVGAFVASNGGVRRAHHHPTMDLAHHHYAYVPVANSGAAHAGPSAFGCFIAKAVGQGPTLRATRLIARPED